MLICILWYKKHPYKEYVIYIYLHEYMYIYSYYISWRCSVYMRACYTWRWWCRCGWRRCAVWWPRRIVSTCRSWRRATGNVCIMCVCVCASTNACISDGGRHSATARRHYGKGIDAFNAARWEEAMTHFNQAAAVDRYVWCMHECEWMDRCMMQEQKAFGLMNQKGLILS